MSFGFNPSSLSFHVLTEDEFKHRFFYTKFKFSDSRQAILGMRMDYTIVFDIKEAVETGASRVFLMILNSRILKKMKRDYDERNNMLFPSISKKLLDVYNLDVKDLMDNDKVLFAEVHGKSFINTFSMSISFFPEKHLSKEEREDERAREEAGKASLLVQDQ